MGELMRMQEIGYPARRLIGGRLTKRKIIYIGKFIIIHEYSKHECSFYLEVLFLLAAFPENHSSARD